MQVCTIKLYTGVINYVSQLTRVYLTAIHFQPNLILTGKTGAYPFDGTPLKGWVPSLAQRYYTRAERTDSDKHPSLLQYRINYECKKI